MVSLKTDQKKNKLLSARVLVLALLILLSLGLVGQPAEAQISGLITRLVAESIGLDAAVVEMGWETVEQAGQTSRRWVIPAQAAGWHKDSSLPGQGGNIVLSGYNNSRGEVFRNLGDLENGAILTLYSAGQPHHYVVVQKLFLKDEGVSPETRRQNARWIGPINEERLTLVSNWPYVDSTHKVIIVAWPMEQEPAAPSAATNPGPTDPQEPASTAADPPSLADNPLVAEIERPSQDAPEETGAANASPQSTSLSRIVAPTIGLNTSVKPVGWQQIIKAGQPKNVWQVAEYAAGWHKNSKLPGQGGNVVFSGHHNIKGQVFRHLVDLSPGDLVTVFQGDQPYYYSVIDKMILKEKGEPPEVRRQNAQWIGPADEERLTLVTCWPYHTNSHRLIVVAKPAPAPAEPLAVNPFAIEKSPAVVASSPVPASDLAVPAAIFPTPAPVPAVPAASMPPNRLEAPAIELDAPVAVQGWRTINRNGQPVKTWSIPSQAAGWHRDSKLPGQGGNVVLSGYHNLKGEIFRNLADLEKGDEITLHAGDQPYPYRVVEKLILRDKGEPEAVRRENARWIGQIDEERLTLVTGWPYTGNTHKLIVIARPEFAGTSN